MPDGDISVGFRPCVLRVSGRLVRSELLQEMGLSWGEAQAAAKDTTLWRNIVVTVCPTGDEEGK